MFENNFLIAYQQGMYLSNFRTVRARETLNRISFSPSFRSECTYVLPKSKVHSLNENMCITTLFFEKKKCVTYFECLTLKLSY